MAAGRSTRNNTLAGLFVLGSVVLTVIVVIVLSNVQDRLVPRNTYVVRFTIVDGAEGIEKGAPVKVGGQRVGRVLKTEFVEDETSGEPAFVDVTIEVPSRFTLYSDADVQLVKPLLGSGSTINIVSFSGMSMSGQEYQGPPHKLTSGSLVKGRLGAPGFVAPSDYAKFQAILARVDRITAEAEPRIGSIMASADEATANVKFITQDAREQWPRWSEKVTSVLDRIEKGSQPFEQIVSSVREGVTKAQEFMDKAKAAVDENRKSVDEIVENVRQLTGKANTEGYNKFVAAIDSAKATMDAAQSAARQVDELLVKKSPELGDIISNSALAAQQLKLTTVEVRAAPWRLLYQPTKKELENEFLYNSVRQYSEAVGELRQAAEALRSVAERSAQATASGTPRAIDPAQVDAMTVKLKAAFDKYQEQERAFLERWIKQDK